MRLRRARMRTPRCRDAAPVRVTLGVTAPPAHPAGGVPSERRVTMAAMPHRTRGSPRIRPGHGFTTGTVLEHPAAIRTEESQAPAEVHVAEEPFLPPQQPAPAPVFFDPPTELRRRVKVGVVPNGKYLDVVIRTIGGGGEDAGDYTDADMTAEE